MRQVAAVYLVLLSLCALVFARSTAEWKERSIYFIMTDRFSQSTAEENAANFICYDLNNYCGGTWKGIQNNLNYIKGLGFNAIWITPIVVNTAYGYHGYWAEDFFNPNPNLGTQQDLVNLVQASHALDIWVMVDMVFNHVGCPSSGACSSGDNDYSAFPQFNSISDYHTFCNVGDASVEDNMEVCWLAGLPDLAQEIPYVNDTLLAYLNYTVVTYGFDGIRIDTVPYIHPNFWSYVQSVADLAAQQLGYSATYTVGEVFDGDNSYVANYQNYLDALLSYPMFFTLGNVFKSQQSATQLTTTVLGYFNNFNDPYALGTFFDNHDNDRFLCDQQDLTLFSNTIVWTLFAFGIPIIYYGTEQKFDGCNVNNVNRQIMWTSFDNSSLFYQYIATLNGIRQQFAADLPTAAQLELLSEDSAYVFTRTSTVSAAGCSAAAEPESDRLDCAFAGITEQGCVARGCCWQVAVTSGAPYCFFPSTSYYNPLYIVAVTNVGASGSDVDISIPNGGNGGLYLVNALDETDVILVSNSTPISITLSGGLPKIYLASTTPPTGSTPTLPPTTSPSTSTSTIFYYYNPAWASDSTVATVQLWMWNYDYSQEVKVNLISCNASGFYFATISAIPGAVTNGRYLPVALNSQGSSFLYDHAGCSGSNNYPPGFINYANSANLLVSVEGCGGLLISPFNEQYQGAHLCVPTVTPTPTATTTPTSTSTPTPSSTRKTTPTPKPTVFTPTSSSTDATPTPKPSSNAGAITGGIIGGLVGLVLLLLQLENQLS